MSSEIQLIIKSPVRREDFPLVFPLDQTVGQLKGRLAEEYPGRPGPASQKLIFAGRLLQDSATIQSVLESQKRAISGPHTFHLVVPPPEAPRPSSFVEEQGGYVPQPAAAPAAAAPPPALPRMPAGGGGAGGMGAWRQQQLQQEEEQGFGFDAQQQAAGAYGLFRPNWALLIRLVLAVYIFGQGGSWGRIVFLSVASALYYAYQIGAFNSFQRVIVVRAEPARQAPPPQPQPREEQPQQHQEQPQQNESTPPTETTTRSPPSSSLGLYRELENVVVPFFYSLLPSWQPGMGVHHVPAPPPAPAPAPVPAAAPAFHPHQD